MRDIAKQKAWTARNRIEHPEKWQEYRRKSRYGVDNIMYNNALLMQEFRCAICKSSLDLQSPQMVHTDHNHETGEFRGLLCRDCNLVIGHAYDDIGVLESAIAYLKSHEK